MRKNSIIILLAVTTLFTVTSCKKFLEQESPNNVPVSEIFTNFEGARTTLVGCYENLKANDYYLKFFYAFPEVTGGNIKYTRAANQSLGLSFNFTNNNIDNDMRGFYNTAYRIIYNANNILAYIGNVTDASEIQKNRMLADAYTIRALVHFDLVRVFAQSYAYTPDASHPGIILKTVNGAVIEPAGNRASVKEVYDQVVKDLDSAIALYANSTAIYAGGNEKTWLSGDAAKALLSRVHLYRGDWEKVIALATDIITPNNYRLLTRAQYVNSWSRKNISNESIFELAYGTRTGGSLGENYNPLVTSQVQWAATNDVLNLYVPADIRSSATMFVKATISGTEYFFPKKYQGTSDSANNIKLIRTSELLLNRAEAYAESNMLTEALADLNTIRKRANTSATNFSSTDQQEIINEILTERRRELCFEGHTFFDVGRKRKNLVRIDCVSANANINYPDDKFACPIPISQ
ncbi:MAG: RagB/SusD family nutrient uptake outer membrane protein [Chitinophagaceae bacterium]